MKLGIHLLLVALAIHIAIADDKQDAIIPADPFAADAAALRAAAQEDGKPYKAEPPVNALTKAFNEPLLSDPDLGKREIYRFSHFPTFDKPTLFRLDVIEENRATLTVKRLSGKGGYDPGRVESSSSHSLQGEALVNLLKTLREPRTHKPFGNLTQGEVDSIEGLDGSSWYLESRVNENFHCAAVWSARSLQGTKQRLEKEGYERSKQIDPDSFVSACLALAAAGGYGPSHERDVFTPTP